MLNHTCFDVQVVFVTLTSLQAMDAKRRMEPIREPVNAQITLALSEKAIDNFCNLFFFSNAMRVQPHSVLVLGLQNNFSNAEF